MKHAAKTPRPGRPGKMPRPGRPGKAPRPGRPGRFNQRGVTLFELLLVLFVAAFVAVAVATIYNRVNTTYKENALFNDTQQLAANIRSLFGGQGNYDAGSKTLGEVAIDAGIVPQTMTNDSGHRIHAFSNTNPSWSADSINSDEEFEITLSNLPNSAVCNGMATKGLNTVEEVKVGSTARTTVAEIVTACSAATVPNVVYVYN